MTDVLDSELSQDSNARVVSYRCSCGGEVLLQAGGETTCPSCSRAVTLEGLDSGQTVSYMDDIGSGTSFHLSDGPDRTGEELGHFRLLSKLGYGGMGAVYRALDESLQRFVAVKVIRSAADGGRSSDKQISRLLDEAIAQARLNHPNVVTIYYVGREGEGEEPFLAMELLPGPTLAELLRDGPLPYEDVILYARQVTSALDHASRMGLVHGDIKPSNLILSDAKTVKLSDFGLAQTEQSLPVKGISGTINYMAPELACGGEPSDRSDMYSLGVTLFELSFGRRPYNVFGTTLGEQISSKQGVEPEFPERWPNSVPEPWKLFLKRLMAKEPNERFANFAELDEALASMAPVGVTNAGLLNRGLAFGLDWALQWILMLPFLIPAQVSLLARTMELPDYLMPLTGNIRYLGILAPIIPAIFLWGEWRGFRTVGRYLFQLRVADNHGLRLGRQKKFYRSIARNFPAWAQSISIVLMASGLYDFSVLFAPFFYAILLINIVPVLGPRRLAVHDRLFGSRVVLNTDGPLSKQH